MPTSINGAAPALGSGQSGPSASPTSPPNSDQSLAKWRKVQMADFLRLMADNQRVLDSSLGNVKTLNQQTSQLRAGKVQETGLAGPPAAPAETDMAGMGDIKIDSPDTHNHYYALQPPPQAPSPATPAPVPAAVPTAPPAANPVPTKSWLPTALAVLGSAAAAGLIGYLLHQSPATPAPTINVPAPTNTSLFSGFGLDLEQALEATGTAP